MNFTYSLYCRRLSLKGRGFVPTEDGGEIYRPSLENVEDQRNNPTIEIYNGDANSYPQYLRRFSGLPFGNAGIYHMPKSRYYIHNGKPYNIPHNFPLDTLMEILSRNIPNGILHDYLQDNENIKKDLPQLMRHIAYNPRNPKLEDQQQFLASFLPAYFTGISLKRHVNERNSKLPFIEHYIKQYSPINTLDSLIKDTIKEQYIPERINHIPSVISRNRFPPWIMEAEDRDELINRAHNDIANTNARRRLEQS